MLYTLAFEQVGCFWSKYVDDFLPVVGVLEPGAEHAGRQFDVILQAVCAPTNAKGLVRGIFAGCEFDSAGGDVENVHVPVKDQLGTG